MKQIGLLLVLPIFLVLSCGSGPQTAEPAPAEPAPAVIAAPAQTTPPPPPPPPPQVVESTPPQEAVFDPASITEEKYTSTMADLQALIGSLNTIIRARNYNAWTGYLAESYFKEINSPAFLEERTEELYRRDQVVASNTGRDPRQVRKRLLRNSRDYFDHVVVPSRSNDRLDDIAFVSENRVKAYTVDSRGNRLILYDLEIVDDKWKIIH